MQHDDSATPDAPGATPGERVDLQRTLVLGAALAALASSVIALWQLRGADESRAALAERLDRVERSAVRSGDEGPAPDSATLELRVTALERRLAVAVAALESTLPQTEARHSAERKRVIDEIEALKRDLKGLSATVAERGAVVDAGVGVAAESDAGSIASADVEEDVDADEEVAEADDADVAAAPAEAAAPALVRRDELLETLRDQAVREAARSFSALAGLSDAQAETVESALVERRDRQREIVQEVSLGRLSVRDAAMQLEAANDAARRGVAGSLSQAQREHFARVMSRLDGLALYF